MNLTEMEAKVREATNNEPWGAPTTLMGQIASGTYNYREREEIIGFIFRRFTEKAANEWRQIYKLLQLLDYLIKNGLERIIDDVRANILLIQMLKSFHYIDSKGRDQGINVRNRSKNLVALLNDDALIRTERKKARSNAKKFGGVSSAAYGGASSVTTGPAYGDDGDFTNRVFGDGGVYGARYDDSAAAYNNNNLGPNSNSNSNDNFEEYDVAPTGSSKPTTGSSKVTASRLLKGRSKPKPQKPEQDLLGDLVLFDAPSSAPAAAAAEEDDDFDDFQAAPSQPEKPSLSSNLSNLYQPQTPQFGQPVQQGAFAGQQGHFAGQQGAFSGQPGAFSGQQTSSNAVNYNVNTSSAPSKVPAAKNDAFLSLFSSAKTKTSGTPAATPNPAPTKPQTDDFFGDFSSQGASNTAPKPTTNAANGDIDLLSF